MTVVTAPAGTWRGERQGEGWTFRGLRYARADRFAPPEPVPPPGTTVDATRSGPGAPQTPSRLAAVMGTAAPVPPSEDCLRLTITTPDPQGSRPVLVWLPGGAYLTGSGEWNFYDGRRLSAEGDLVVVTVSYRIGALGYLYAPGTSDGNLGLQDQLAALRWVQENVAAFGGDPDRVTLAGQSAGAHSIAALLGVPDAARLFHRAVLQSAPLGMPFIPPHAAERTAGTFLEHLGTDPLTASVEQVLTAQTRTVIQLAGRFGLNTAPAFGPVADAGPLPAPPAWHRALVRRAGQGLAVLLGTNRDEMRAFHLRHPLFTRVRALPVIGDGLADRARHRAQEKAFDGPNRQFADLLASSGADTYRYVFGRLAPDNPLGACHCAELPLLLGDDAAWRDAPVLAGAPAADLAAAGTRMRSRWSAFVHGGAPGWPRHTPGAGAHPLP
ncbi:carboxylesterase family protein [Streptomyces sp. NPDC058171]